MLTDEAAQAIEKAALIYGSERSIDLVRDHIKPDCSVNTIEDYGRLRALPEEAVVLSTGDPMLSGLGYLPGKVVPGISSLQVACARLKISLLKVVPITVHGRRMDPEPIASELKRGRCVFLLIDDSTDLSGLCSYLKSQGIKGDVAVLTDLGYTEEKMAIGTTDAPPKAPGLSCVMIGQFSASTK